LTPSVIQFTVKVMRQFRLLIALTAIGVSAAIPVAPLLSCMADENATAKAQMACCKSAKPDCAQTSQALQCCKNADHPQQQSFVRAPSVANTLRAESVTVFAANAAAAPPSVRLDVRPAVVVFAGTSSPPYLAFSVLLI
jgi:hypothetical protein